MTTIAEILRHYEDVELTPEVLCTVDALLQCRATQPNKDETPPPSEKKSFIWTQPPQKQRQEKTAPTGVQCEAELLNGVLELVAQAVRLQPLVSRAERTQVAERTSELAKQALESAQRRHTALTTEHRKLRSIAEEISSLEIELNQLCETSQKQRDDLNRKKDEHNRLIDEANTFGSEMQTLDQEIDDLKNKAKEFERKKGEVKKRRKEVEESSKEYDNLQDKLKATEEERRTKETQLCTMKEKKEETRKLIEQIDANPLMQPDMAKRIREIWESLPPDAIDKLILTKIRSD